MRPILLFILAAFAASVPGCAGPSAGPDLSIVPPPPAEVPAANLPAPLRPYNWTDRAGSGSCVNASTVFMLRWRAEPELAQWWRENHAGGETANSIRSHHDRAGLKYVYTTSADGSLLDWATETRRGAIIWFYPRHCVTFCGFHQGDDGREYAYLNDNNRPQQFIRIERSEFLRRWAGYGGFALSILNPPVPPRLYPGFRSA